MENQKTAPAHTPGPWTFSTKDYGQRNNGRWFDILPGDGGLAFTAVVQPSIPTEEAEANARLIAAAPELLTALKDALAALELAKKRDPDQAGLYHCPLAREAAAKAEGSAA